MYKGVPARGMTAARAVMAGSFCVVLSPGMAWGQEERPPLPESLLTESATDVDSTEAGELELEANFATMRARSGGAHVSLVSLEAEWRILQEVGVRLEPTYTRTTRAGSSSDGFGAGGALAIGLAHDFAHDAHLQWELHARSTDRADSFDASETVQPIAGDLVSAVRWGRATLRGTVGIEAGGEYAHAPMHADLAVLTGVVRDARFGFMALEIRTDWARRNPLVLAPEMVADLTPLSLPLRLGVALPLNVGASAERESYGLFLRLILLTERETAFGATGNVGGVR